MHTTTNGSGEALSPLDKMRAASAAKRAAQVEIEGHMLDPIPAARYADLKRLSDKGKISKLRVKPALPLRVASTEGAPKTLSAKYRPLFVYEQAGTTVVEDVPASDLNAKTLHLRNHWELQSAIVVKIIG